MMSTETSFGLWVKRRRKALDLTQQDLARRVGCSASAIFKIESDERRPSRQIAELLAKHLDIHRDQHDLFLSVARREKAADTLEKIQGSDPDSFQAVSYLPLSPGPLIGREFELAEIIRLVRDPHCRLLTLTGQGGIGKTHLAIHTALSLTESNEFRASFVSLAGANNREQAVTAIADGLGIVLYTASDRSNQLITYLRDKDVILILDNFEHLTGEARCVDLIGDILRETRRIKLVITSRHPLQLQSEWVFDVQGLPVPEGRNAEELETSSAVSLFLLRASQAAVGFKPTPADLYAIAHICELVEGLPLGIELAAAWVRTLSCEEIAAEIQKSLDFLVTSTRDLPERHRSIRATIQHSWDLLTPDEQRILRQLSLFRSGFSRPAAEAVAHAGLTDLLGLVSKSLIRRLPSGRYDMHELIQQFALERLMQDASEYEQAQGRHSQYFANLLASRGPALKGSERNTVVSELIADLPNLRQAWQWAASHQQARHIRESADTLFWLYESRSNCREGVPLYGKAVEDLRIRGVESGDVDNRERQLALGQALCYKGFFLFRQGQHPEGRDALRSSLAVLEEIPGWDDPAWRMALSDSIVFLGTVSSVMGDFEEGDRLLEEGLRMKQELGDRWGAGYCLRQIGLSAYSRGQYDRSSSALEQSLAISRELGNTWAMAASLSKLGMDAHAQGKHEQAREYLAEGLALSRAIEDRASIADALDGLGLVSAAQGRYGEAQDLFRESLDLWREIGEQGSLAQTLIHSGETLLRMGEYSSARIQFKEALSVACRAQITPALLEALIGEAEIRQAEGEPEDAFPLALVVSRHPSSSHVTRLRAERLCADTRVQLPPGQEKNLEPDTMHRDLETLVDEILNDKH